METFKIIQPIHPDEEGQVEIDISVWLGSDTIKSVTFSAKNAAGTDATADVLDVGLSGFAGNLIKPYIKGGQDKTSYKVKAVVECNEVSDIGVFMLEFSCRQ